jgi:hypothetical protein
MPTENRLNADGKLQNADGKIVHADGNSDSSEGKPGFSNLDSRMFHQNPRFNPKTADLPIPEDGAPTNPAHRGGAIPHFGRLLQGHKPSDMLWLYQLP